MVALRSSPEREGAGNLRRRVVVSGIASLSLLLALRLFDFRTGVALRDSEAVVRAGSLMEDAVAAIRQHCPDASIDPAVDLNKTGLIGPEYSPLLTSLGQLEAKRSSINPNVAGLIVHLLDEAGVTAGDTVAIGSSGSFPGFLAASLAACKAMKVRPVSILSLGASSYGATNTEFDLLDIYSVLRLAGLCDDPPAAVSLGGGKDSGLDFEPEVRDRLIRKIRATGLPFIDESDLSRNVSRRMAIYQREAKGKIAAFINSGGGYANIGTSPLVLNLKPGLNRFVTLPPREARGVLYEMAARNTPVVHLLFVKGLTQKFGLPWDPVPLPSPADSGFGEVRFGGAAFWLVCAAYFGFLLLLGLPSHLRLGGGFFKKPPQRREDAKNL